MPYTTHPYTVKGGETFLETEEGPLPVEIFGAHNLNNLAGAKWICQHMGIDEDDFYEAIQSFKGASRRMETLAQSDKGILIKDFAHSPSKVKATTEAVKERFGSHKVHACLELHTYSSLNAEFVQHYKGSLDAADEAWVFYSPEAIKIKRLDEISTEQIKSAFGREDLKVFTNPQELAQDLLNIEPQNLALLMMSSGNYGGFNLNDLVKKF